MLRKILETKLGPMTNAEFAEVMDLTETDIRINRLVPIKVGRKRTSLGKLVEIAIGCFIAMGRGNVA
ncbi:hypothetical protein [Desulfosporosinus nitroreducens]|uniref:hypothetical protein n=1 Tax=Desulfosporosinus nitroreducens TaxID=2018668 RepID=UPI00207D5B52|nr:hypothetical protein [Desulfosporosinus nitroreducens]MCO1599785.1 hypothetical protein [Desulfosporosinus nitroreducens]